MTHTESRQFIVLYSDGSRKETPGSSIDGVILKTFWYLTATKKDYTALAIIDVANGEVYTDLKMNLSYIGRDKQWLAQSDKVFSRLTLERLVMSYGKHLGLTPEGTATWLASQEL